VCVDNFYNDPEQIRKFALSLEYNNSEDSEGRYPGKRTKFLHEIDREFFDNFCKKVFSVLYDFRFDIQWEVMTCFHQIPEFDNDVKNLGWIHKDDAIFAGLVYLTPEADLNSGTSFYTLKDGASEDYKDWASVKEKFYKSNIDKKYDEMALEHRSLFNETLRVNNVYNRMILFDSQCYHGINTLKTGTGSRLTQPFFVKKITTSSGLPIHRCKGISNL
jgi:hypothetical protein